MTDPNAVHTDNDHDIRLIPLDPWERDWIFGAVQFALNTLAVVPPTQTNMVFRLEDLLRKMRPHAQHGKLRPVPMEPN